MRPDVTLFSVKNAEILGCAGSLDPAPGLFVRFHDDAVVFSARSGSERIRGDSDVRRASCARAARQEEARTRGQRRVGE